MHYSTYTIYCVVQLLKSWEYKNVSPIWAVQSTVVQLLKSWEYKNFLKYCLPRASVVQLLKSWEYKNPDYNLIHLFEVVQLLKSWEYKNESVQSSVSSKLYSYLNLESTKTSNEILTFLYPHSDYKINNSHCQFLLSKNFCKSFSSDVCGYLIR